MVEGVAAPGVVRYAVDAEDLDAEPPPSVVVRMADAPSEPVLANGCDVVPADRARRDGGVRYCLRSRRSCVAKDRSHEDREPDARLHSPNATQMSTHILPLYEMRQSV